MNEITDQTRRSVSRAMARLTPDTVRVLAGLDGLPEELVVPTIAAMVPLGSRVALADLGVLVRGHVTEFGWHVLAACALQEGLL